MAREGYENDTLDRAKILASLSDTLSCELQLLDTVESTNDTLKKLALEGAPSWTVVAANSQTRGRGKSGRRFYSPPGSGLYMSLLLRDLPVRSGGLYLSSLAALAAAEAVEHCFGINVRIKWVNDLYLVDKKICGILCESSIDPRGPRFSAVVIGIGMNFYPPRGAFPPELQAVAGSLFADGKSCPGAKNAWLAEFLNLFHAFLSLPDESRNRQFIQRYREKSLLLGREIEVKENDHISRALAEDLTAEGELLIRDADGRKRALCAAEVRLA